MHLLGRQAPFGFHSFCTSDFSRKSTRKNTKKRRRRHMYLTNGYYSSFSIITMARYHTSNAHLMYINNPRDLQSLSRRYIFPSPSITKLRSMQLVKIRPLRQRPSSRYRPYNNASHLEHRSLWSSSKFMQKSSVVVGFLEKEVTIDLTKRILGGK